MEPAQALADLVEISSQIEAVVLVEGDGSVVASTLADAAKAGALAAVAQDVVARAEAVAAGRDVTQVEVSLAEGSVFAVRSGPRTILATTRPDPTVGLVLYDLRSCLRNAAVAPEAKPKRARAKKPAAPPEGGGDAAA
jgi:predicted regulator of Ras-like GTPase activity (Roadblock/LC7/MglB family)